MQQEDTLAPVEICAGLHPEGHHFVACMKKCSGGWHHLQGVSKGVHDPCFLLKVKLNLYLLCKLVHWGHQVKPDLRVLQRDHAPAGGVSTEQKT